MVTRLPARWAVRFSVTRTGGWRAWGGVRGEFEHALAATAGKTVIAPRIDSETRRGRDFVRVTMVMTVVAADVAAALTIGWMAFARASGDDAGGWDETSTLAEVQPSGP